MSEQEIWKDVVGYDGRYQVSNKGNVRSVERKNSIGRKCGGRTLRPETTKDGYLRLNLYKNGIKKNKFIHRLVLEAFIPNPKKLPEVNHKDENKTNNELSNLEWCDTRYNANYGTRNKKISQKKCKKVKAINVENGEIITFSSTLEAGNKGYNSTNVGKACRGVHTSGNGNLMGGDGRTYKGHRWYYI